MQIPITPTTTIHASRIPNRAPVSALATRSPMSTNPPNAVSTPRKTSKMRFISAVPLGEALEPFGEVTQRRHDPLEPLGLGAACGDARELDDVDGAVHVVEQLCAKVARLRVRRLDRREGIRGRCGVRLGV